MPTTNRYTSLIRVPVTGGGTAIAKNALLMPGVTQGTNLGLAIVADATAAQAIGFIKGNHTVATDSTQTGTIWTFHDVELIRPAELIEWEYSQATADILSVTSVSTTTVTITSLENNMDCSWLYAVSGTGAGLLAFCTAATGGTATTKTATGWDSTTKVVKILRNFHRLLTPNTATTKLKTQAAAGAMTVDVLESYVSAPKSGLGKVLLDPTKHDNLTLSNPVFTTRVLHRVTVGV